LGEKKLKNYRIAFAIRINSGDKRLLNGNIIKSALNKICRGFKVALDGFAEIYISYNREDKGMKCVSTFFEDVDDINHKLAMFTEKAYKTEKGLNQRKVTIHACLLKNDGLNKYEYLEPDSFDTITADYKNTDIFVYTRNTQSENQKELKKNLEILSELENSGIDPDEALNSEDFQNGLSILDASVKDNRLEQGIAAVEKIILKGRMSIRLCSNLYVCICECCFNSDRVFENKYLTTLGYAKKAIGIDSEFSDAYNNAGVASINLGEPENAIEYLKKALTIDCKWHVPTCNWRKNNWQKKMKEDFQERALPAMNLRKCIKSRSNHIKPMIWTARSFILRISLITII
jgi:tetratricopeptide (TPR) repeat protein